MLNDLRYAIRDLARAPAFAVVCILTLALGIGATTAVFSVVYGVLMRPLPYPNAAQIVRVIQLLPLRAGSSEPTRAGMSPAQIQEWRSHSSTLADMAVVSVASATMTGSGDPVRLNGARVSPGLFSILGVRPLMGRTFVRDEELPASAPTVILGYATWVKRFGSDSGILDRTITLDDRSYQVVGVMPNGVNFPERGPAAQQGNSTGRLEGGPDYWLPFQIAAPSGRRSGGFSMAPAVALIKDGVTLQRAIAEANSIVPALPNGQRLKVDLVNVRDEMGRQIKPVLLAFQLGVLFVLLIACINVTNLLLARAARRRREFAIRVALGGRGLQIARTVIAEGVLISVAGGVLGWFIADAGLTALRSLPIGTIPRLDDVRLDWTMFVFGLSLSLVAGVLIGTVVSIRILRSNPWAWLRQSGMTSQAVPTFSHGRPSNILVTASIAAAVILTACAGLLLNSFARLTGVDTGFDASRLLAFEIALPARSQYADPLKQQQFYRQLAESLREVAGAESATVASALPFQLSGIGFPLTLPGQAPTNDGVSYRAVMPGYFRTLRISLLRGREFGPIDRGGAPRSIIVNETFSRRYFGGLDAIERDVQFMDDTALRIVGIVRDTKASRLDVESMPEIYYPYEQPPKSGGYLNAAGVVRATGDRPLDLLPAVRTAVRNLDPSLAVYNAASMDQIVAESFALSRLYTSTAASFGTVALMLAVIGLYGLLAYSVSSRTQEIGIRIALGATSRAIRWNVLRDGLLMTSVGLAVGLAGAVVLSRFLQGLLYGVKPQDPATFAAAGLLFLVVAAAASYVPARRATKVDPIVALRTE